VVVWSRPARGGIANISPANFLDFRDQNRVFDHMGAGSQAEFNVSVQGVAERLTGFRVSADFFETLGVKPGLGRSFAAGDDRPGAPRVAILSHGAWQRRFGGDRSILGQALTVDGEKCMIVGVMPASFRFAYAPEMLAPLAPDPATAARDFHVLFAFAKLKRGVPLAQARSEMQGLARNLERAYPKALKGWGVDLWPWRDNFVGGDRQRVLVLFGAVGFVLLIACVNLANLLLAKAAVRQRELAVRAALGAWRARLMRQVLTESVLLSGMGGMAGVLLARWLVPLAATLVSPPILAGIAEVGIDWRVLGFTLGLSVLTGLLFGLAPAW
jgi:putative ABC transport system permease protein